MSSLVSKGPHAVAYENHPTDSRIKELDGVGPTVAARWGTGGGNQPLVQAAVAFDGYNQTLSETNQTIRSDKSDGDHIGMVFRAMQVRRLTPVECERLQGFPDDWTRIPWRKKEAQDCPDGPRYKAIGNSMAVNVMQWIGMRIAMVEEITDEIS